jgi:radical SAM superfamily enzyme YgiQ (UPF0313 family)
VGIDYHPFPFSLAYATARLDADGHEAMLVDCIADGMSLEGLKSIAYAFEPDVVFMETSAPSWRYDIDAKDALTRPTIAGGAHATATCAAHIDAGFDGVICGEYDQVISEAIQLAPQPWLAMKDQLDVSHVPMVQALDEIPYPAWGQMTMEKYNDPFCKGRTVTVLASRGCPWDCGFCTIAPYQGKRNYRRRDPERVCDEIDALIARYDPDEIYFDDDTITINPKHAIDLFETYKRRIPLPFSCMGNAVIEPEVVRAMAEAGCRAIKCGVESSDPEVLRRIPKKQNPEEVQRTVADCRKHGIEVHANFLVGLAGETKESALRTVDFALDLNTHTLQFAIATPYPGTAFYEEAKREGWLTKDSWMQFDPSGEAVVSYPDYTADDIADMYALAWRRWQWHMMTRRPRTVLHHFSNAVRREGLAGLLRISLYSAQRLVKVVANH